VLRANVGSTTGKIESNYGVRRELDQLELSAIEACSIESVLHGFLISEFATSWWNFVPERMANTRG